MIDRLITNMNLFLSAKGDGLGIAAGRGGVGRLSCLLVAGGVFSLSGAPIKCHNLILPA